MGIDDEEDFPLADHPGDVGPKAGDPQMNRARDLMHLDVAGHQKRNLAPSTQHEVARNQPAPPPIPASASPMVAWEAFQKSDAYGDTLARDDGGWSMFLAGWTARDSQPKE